MNFKLKAVLLIILAFLTYLFFTDFDLVKKMVGYNIPSLSYLKLPEGFKIDIFAKDLEDPRVIAFDSAGRMLVSETEKGDIVLLEDKDKNGTAETRKTVLSGLNKPHGLAFYSSGNTTYLYVAETQQVARYVYDIKNGVVISAKGQNITNLPADGKHFTRTIAFGPNFRKSRIISTVNTQIDTKLYISVGSSCDVCVEDTTWKRAAILESDPEGSYTAEFAGGLRNSVFFTFHPVTKEIWATEMGRDNLGDNLPPGEINIIKVAGPEDKFGAKRYGWPFCYSNQVKDKTFNPEKFQRIDISSDCSKTESPVIQIPAHSAPLGLAFIAPSTHSTKPQGGEPVESTSSLDQTWDKSGQANKWPPEWQNDLLVAYHGSWNSSVPVGYKIVRYNLDANGNVLSQKPNDFISGWLSDGGNPSISSFDTAQDKSGQEIFGQPVDLKFGPDGALYISDDAAGIIYRVIPK